MRRLVYVLILDGTDHNGDRTFYGVYDSQEEAEVAGEWEVEKLRSWADAHAEVDGRNYGSWIPRVVVEAAAFYGKG